MSKSNGFEQAGKTAVLQNIQGLMEQLGKYPPFNQMEPSHLAYLIEHCQLRFYAEGDVILSPDGKPVEYFFIVKQGLIRGERTLDDVTEATFEISTGECFPLAALIGERSTRTLHRAARDSFCLQLPKADFVKLFSLSAAFRDFSLRGVSSLLEQVNQQVQRQAVETLGSQYSLDTRLQHIAVRRPVTCSPQTSLRGAVRMMHDSHVGSIVILDEQQQPIGIFTLRDLRRVVADGTLDFNQPIERAMTPDPFHLPPTASAFDAALSMTERHIAHVCVVEAQRLVGVVSERDLFSLQRVDLVHLARTIRNAANLAQLAALRHDITHLVDNMLAHGASAGQITHIITLLNDHCLTRVIELNLTAETPPFTWLCFGSEGRSEQTLHTDQDNGILFAASSSHEAEQTRQALLPLAQRINHDLADLGFERCRGNIMASNPELCLSEREWQQRFASLVRTTTPENLLASSIYFDLRAPWGDLRPVQKLQQAILKDIADTSQFQRMMAANALRHRPPLGTFRSFVVSRRGADKDTLDLKLHGLTPFVDGARLLALSHGIAHTNTLERLRQLVGKGIIAEKDGAAYEEAYTFIQLIRLQLHQKQSRANLPLGNRVDPDELNHLDRRILRESFRQAQRLQASLTLRYQL